MYPLLLVIAHMDYDGVWFVQSLLGVGISVLLFLLVLEIVPSIWLAFAIALLHSLTLNQLFYEAIVLAETLATFLVVASVLLFIRALKSGNRVGIHVVVGLCVAAATLTRPQYIYLGPLYIVLMLMMTRGRRRSLVFALTASFCLPLIGWVIFNKAHVGYFGLTTQMGMSLAQHSGKFISFAPDEFAALRDIYMRHRARMPANADHMTVWEAVPDMLAETQLSFIDLNRQLTKLSLLLFARYPDLYLRSVLDAWIGFWPVQNLWNPELIRSSAMKRALLSLWSVEHVVLRGMNLVFFLLAIALAVPALLRSLKDRRINAYLILACIVLAGSFVQAFLEATDNARYSIPTQPLVVVFVLCLGYECIRARRDRRRRADLS
jgi:hypothetical protein